MKHANKKFPPVDMIARRMSDTVITDHEAAANPHAQYALDTDLETLRKELAALSQTHLGEL